MLLKTAYPRLPAAEEIDAHNLTHLSHRSWCPHCVRVKGKTMDHRRAGRDKLVPEIHVDCCFMRSKTDVTTRCIVVAKDYSSKSVMASVVPVKVSSHEFPAKRSTRLYVNLVWRRLCKTCWRKSVADVSQPRHSTRSGVVG